MSALARVDTDVLPSRPDAERSLLGSLLINGALVTRVMEFLVAEDFATEAHRLIYESCLSLGDRREGIDLVTVQNELERNGRLDRAGGPPYLAGLLDIVPDLDNYESYARLVRESSIHPAHGHPPCAQDGARRRPGP